MSKAREGWTVIGVNKIIFGSDPEPPSEKEAAPEVKTVRTG